jgi:hypothetical protein
MSAKLPLLAECAADRAPDKERSPKKPKINPIQMLSTYRKQPVMTRRKAPKAVKKSEATR